MVNDKGLSRNKKDILDPFVIQQTSKLIDQYYNTLNRIDTQDWTVKEIVDYIQKGKDGISFSMYARKHIEKMKARGQERTSRDYKWALYSLEKFAGDNEIMFSQLTYSFLSRWIDSISQTARSKNKYPINIRQIHKAAMLEYNDEERGILLITNPWPKISIPKEDTPNKRAISPNMLRRFFAVVPDFSRFTHPLQELGQDIALISFCMCGINSIDLFYAKKSQYHNGIFHYNRRKTSKSRSDNAYFEIRVPQFIKPTFEKYLSKNIESPWLFDFQDRLSTSDSFNANINAGISQICKKVSPDFHASLYSFRHSWATIAQNGCGASLGDVDFALNHSTFKLARVYTKIDYSPAWELNEKVIDYVFFSNEDIEKSEDANTFFERMSKYNLIRGEAFICGNRVCVIEDSGFTNVEQVIMKLLVSLPNDISRPSKVQIKITNLDKKQTQLYQRLIQ
ncbi:transposase [Prevotella lacticifex]|uniref:Transposase n=3 Tax=Prevotella lacticifex TaxID=2854755 RepID=A0A9R1C854_9BACT|nr:transposase [Prevotella lacticifex]GJG40872.1 transposase [Prevotella lacticifex]GJG43658.1 transposase [Prevotella lacticifex]GJG47439.1 transposase [Prevotella lacticifex]GJG49909.1 transposase [Prevotella lacticifex]